MMLKNEPEILVLGTADWNQPIATNQHYMVRELAREYSTIFVESLGLRRPEFKPRDLRRMALRVTGGSHRRQQGRVKPPNMSVISPTVVPLHNKPWSTVNRRLLAHTFSKWSSEAHRVFWTYSPVTYGFERGAKVSVYHCVDLYGQFPGIDSDLIDREERRLAATGIQAIGSSQVVVEHLKSQGFRDVLYWPNVADTQEIASTQREGQRRGSGAIFAGNLSEKKVDFSVLHNIIESGVELHLAGPVAEGGGASQARVDELVAAGASYHGVLTLSELSTLMFKCRVGLIPYLRTPYTHGVSPLKTYEYLAAGLTVISTPIPGVEEEHPHIYTPEDDDKFVERVRVASQESTHHLEIERLAIADRHSWAQRGHDARELVKMRGNFR